MTIRLPELPYPYDALSPHMSAETLRYHHDKHHKSYVDKLNGLLDQTKLAQSSLEEIIEKTAGDKDRVGIFNNAAQCWNHTFFWNSMSPDGGGSPNGHLAHQIEKDLGGMESFLESFRTAAVKQFGSGWAWLVLDGQTLKITTTPNAVPPMVYGQHPLLTCDVWEHAYYLDYQNRRGEFVGAFLENLVNWDFVAEQFARHGGAAPAEQRRTGTGG